MGKPIVKPSASGYREAVIVRILLSAWFVISSASTAQGEKVRRTPSFCWTEMLLPALKDNPLIGGADAVISAKERLSAAGGLYPPGETAFFLFSCPDRRMPSQAIPMIRGVGPFVRAQVTTTTLYAFGQLQALQTGSGDQRIVPFGSRWGG